MEIKWAVDEWGRVRVGKLNSLNESFKIASLKLAVICV